MPEVFSRRFATRLHGFAAQFCRSQREKNTSGTQGTTHTNCHQDSCQEDGYVCSRKLFVSEKAIAAYRKAVEGTTIFKNAEDYDLVLLITDYRLAFYWRICPIAFQSMFIEYDKLRALQSIDNMFPFMCLEYHTAWVWIWVGHKV